MQYRLLKLGIIFVFERVRRKVKHYIYAATVRTPQESENLWCQTESLMAWFHRLMLGILDGWFVIPEKTLRGKDGGWTSRC